MINVPDKLGIKIKTSWEIMRETLAWLEMDGTANRNRQ
jgi:hypothetical protein